MRYAIRDEAGNYLRKVGPCRRKWVDTLEGATLWSGIGPAKLALRAAAEGRALKRGDYELVCVVPMISHYTTVRLSYHNGWTIEEEA